MAQHVRLRTRILVKAFPQQSKKQEETVCCAGISEDGQQMLRLFPIRFRRLPKGQQFDRFGLVEVLATKASDPRPESYRVDEGSIQLIEKASTLSNEAKVRLWQPFIAPSLKALHEENRKTQRSLGIIRPDPGSLKFFCKPAQEAETQEREIAEAVQQVQQSSLLEDPLKAAGEAGVRVRLSLHFRWPHPQPHHPRLGSAGRLPALQAALRRASPRAAHARVRREHP